MPGMSSVTETPPDIILLGPEWPERALLRAQLIEEGYDVVALDVWPIPRLYRRPGMKPRVLLIDLRGLPDPRETLDEVRFVIPPDRVLVITALGGLTNDDVRRLGFPVIGRPATVSQIVSTVRGVLSARRETGISSAQKATGGNSGTSNRW